MDQRHAGFGFQRLHPGVLGQDIQYRQQIPNASIILGQGLDFHQIRHPLIIQSPYDHGHDVAVYATCRPNPVPTRVGLFSKESDAPKQTVTRPLNCRGLSDHGNGPTIVVRHLAFLSFEVPYLLTLIPQGLYGRDCVGVRLLNGSIPSPRLRMGFQPQDKHHPSIQVEVHVGVFKHFERMRVLRTCGNGYFLTCLVVI